MDCHILQELNMLYSSKLYKPTGKKKAMTPSTINHTYERLDRGHVYRQSKDRHATSLIYKGDCIELLHAIPDDSLDLVVTSPPYNLGKEYERKQRLSEYIRGQAEVIKLCIDKIADTGSICWQVGNFVENGMVVPLDLELHHIFKDAGMSMRNRIIWHFGHGLHCSKRFSGRYETIMWYSKSDDYKFNLDPVRVPSKYPNKRYYRGNRKGELSCNPLGKNPSDVWDIPNVKHNHIEKTEHPAQFPVGLVERLVLALTDENDIVCDPYMGSGSTGVAALKNGRNSIGGEKYAKYVRLAVNRIEALCQDKLVTRPMNKPIYQPN